MSWFVLLDLCLVEYRGVELQADGVDVVSEVHAVLKKIQEFSMRVRSGQHLGATGKPLKVSLNILPSKPAAESM